MLQKELGLLGIGVQRVFQNQIVGLLFGFLHSQMSSLTAHFLFWQSDLHALKTIPSPVYYGSHIDSLI